MMFDKVRRRIVWDIIYGRMRVGVRGYIVLYWCESFMKWDRIMGRRGICWKVNNVWDIVLFLGCGFWRRGWLVSVLGFEKVGVVGLGL